MNASDTEEWDGPTGLCGLITLDCPLIFRAVKGNEIFFRGSWLHWERAH